MPHALTIGQREFLRLAAQTDDEATRRAAFVKASLVKEGAVPATVKRRMTELINRQDSQAYIDKQVAVSEMDSRRAARDRQDEMAEATYSPTEMLVLIQDNLCDQLLKEAKRLENDEGGKRSMAGFNDGCKVAMEIFKLVGQKPVTDVKEVEEALAAVVGKFGKGAATHLVNALTQDGGVA